MSRKRRAGSRTSRRRNNAPMRPDARPAVQTETVSPLWMGEEALARSGDHPPFPLEANAPALPHQKATVPLDETSLSRAAALFRKNRLEEADQLCLSLLVKEGAHGDLLGLRGLIAQRQGNLEAARVFFTQACEHQPENPGRHHFLGLTLQALNRPREALASFQRAAQLAPKDPAAPLQAGTLLLRLDGPQAALPSLQEAARLDPDSPQPCKWLGLAQQRLGAIEAARENFETSLRLDPNQAETHILLGKLLVDAGFSRAGLDHLITALELGPGEAEAFFNLGLAFETLNQPEEQERCYRLAIEMRPAFPEALNNLGILLQRSGRWAESLACFQQALTCRPDHWEALNNQGVTLRLLGRFEEADALFTRVLAARPDSADAHANQALIRLAFKDFERGWSQYDWRWRRSGAPRRNLDRPEWRGEDLTGKTLLFRAEQGFGDTIQFLRFLPELRRRGAQVIAAVQRPLVALTARMEEAGMGDRMGEPMEKIQAVCETDPPPPHDCFIDAFSLPAALGIRADAIPNAVPYLRGDPNHKPRWAARLEPGFLNVGLVWAGRPTHDNDRHRSLDPALLAPLFKRKGARIFSLQRETTPEARALLDRLGITGHWGEELGDFLDAAGAVEALDLLVSVDTALAHLAGALARPVWTLIPANPDWRWFLDGSRDTPWYPTMTLFRQKHLGEWPPVIDQVAEALSDMILQKKSVSG